jgi:hypothetical protein
MNEPIPSREAEDKARWRPWLGILGLAAVVPVIGMSAGIARPETTCACSQTLPPPPSSPVVGVIVAYDATEYGWLESVTIRPAGGDELRLRGGVPEPDDAYSLTELAEHLANQTPVEAHFRMNGDVPEVYRIEPAT